jgi:hypothetical protein
LLKFHKDPRLVSIIHRYMRSRVLHSFWWIVQGTNQRSFKCIWRFLECLGKNPKFLDFVILAEQFSWNSVIFCWLRPSGETMKPCCFHLVDHKIAEIMFIKCYLVSCSRNLKNQAVQTSKPVLWGSLVPVLKLRIQGKILWPEPELTSFCWNWHKNIRYWN